MSDAIERINEIIERSYVKYNFLDENNRPQIKGKAYRIDDQRSFQVFSFMNGSEEITIAAIFYDYNETRVIEYNYSGESEDYYAVEEDEPERDEPAVQ